MDYLREGVGLLFVAGIGYFMFGVGASGFWYTLTLCFLVLHAQTTTPFSAELGMTALSAVIGSGVAFVEGYPVAAISGVVFAVSLVANAVYKTRKSRHE